LTLFDHNDVRPRALLVLIGSTRETRPPCSIVITPKKKKGLRPGSMPSEEAVRRLEAVTDTALARLSLEGLLSELLVRVRSILGADTAAILLLNGGDLVARVAKGLEEEDPARTARALEVIDRSARAQARLVDDLLEVSRMIGGKLHLEVRPMRLAAAIEAAIEAMRPAASARNIRVETRLDPRIDLIQGDPDRLQQVVWNLLSNAIKFTPEGGRVDLVLERVDSHLELTVRDTGKGIRSEFLPYVFERFRQADASVTRALGGLGLGLAIARHLVELHGGTIEAESAGEGKGATFRVRIPLRVATEDTRAHEAREGSAGEELTPLNGLRVLVVDDEPDTCDVLEAVLREAGAEVRACQSTAEALAELDTWWPDVLLSDIGMPGEDGYSLIRRVRAREARHGRAIAAVALTAYARADDRRKALSAGFQMHVPKPIDGDDLIAVVVRARAAAS